jgi:mannitol 2-dehydrogenase
MGPRTFLGYLAESANRRMKSGIKPFTIMSCDNVECNGVAARKALLSFAEMRDPGLRKWIERNVSFPNSMVDRITPGTTDADREYIGTHFGISDLCPVVAEPFRQWVIEDAFCNSRPQWELAGAQLTADVRPFEIIKMRLLNGGHSAIAYLSALLGHVFVSHAVDDALIRELLDRFLEEVTCTLPQAPGMDLAQYKLSIVHRFSNPAMRDQISRVCSEGSAKIAKFIVPTVRDLLSMSKDPQILPFVIAGWLYSMRGIDEEGRATQIVDSSAGLFADFVRSGCRDERAAFAVRSVFADLGTEDNPFVSKVKQCLDSLHSSGAREAIRRVADSRSVS